MFSQNGTFCTGIDDGEQPLLQVIEIEFEEDPEEEPLIMTGSFVIDIPEGGNAVVCTPFGFIV